MKKVATFAKKIEDIDDKYYHRVKKYCHYISKLEVLHTAYVI